MLSQQARTAVTLTLALLTALLWAVLSFVLGYTIPRQEVSLLSVLSEGSTCIMVFIAFGASTSLHLNQRSRLLLRGAFLLLFFATFQDMLDELVMVEGLLPKLIEDIGIPAGFLLLGLGLLETGHTLQSRSCQLDETLERERRLCSVDQLTMLMNRRQFFKLGPELLNHCNHNGRSITALIFSIRDLEQINLDHGYKVGDRLLKKFAHILRKDLDQRHLCARLTGGQFALMLSDVLPEEARQVADNIETAATAIAVLNEHGDELVIKLHLNSGIAEASTNDSIDCLLHRAHAREIREN